MSITALHQPVLIKEALALLDVKANHWYLDATFGRGGHTQAILEKKAKVIALDFDQQAISWGQKQFTTAINQGNLKLIRENFTQLNQVVKEVLSGILFDFGTSLDQLKSTTTGISFETTTAQLDMRLDNRLAIQATDLLMLLPERELAQIFFEYGGESQARLIAKSICQYRKKQKIATVGQLLDIIQSIKKHKVGHLHPATKVFQALRIAVNDELNNIKQALPLAFAHLAPRGHLVCISFHEGEDRLIKHFFKKLMHDKQATMLTKKPLTPTAIEISLNPRARSAKLRAIEKI